MIGLRSREFRLVVAGAGSVLMALAGCGGGDEEGPAGSNRKMVPAVQTQTARPEDISRLLVLDGSVEPVRLAMVASPAEGPVQDLQVREGDCVRRGDLLLRIGRNQAAEAAVVAARQQLVQEEQEQQRVAKLVASGSIPGEQLDISQARLEQARAQLAAAEQGRTDHRVVAPWDGVVSRVLVRDGAYVTPRTPLVDLFDPATLVIRFSVPAAAAVAVANGAQAKVSLDAYPGQSFGAVVSRVYPELDRRTRTRTVEATLSDRVALVPGMFARLSLAVETAHGAVVVPDRAVLATPRGDQVAFVVEAGKARRRQVETGIEQGHRVQILAGIQPGEPVVVAGHEKLQDGAQVRILKPAVAKQAPTSAGGR